MTKRSKRTDPQLFQTKVRLIEAFYNPVHIIVYQQGILLVFKNVGGCVSTARKFSVY